MGGSGGPCLRIAETGLFLLLMHACGGDGVMPGTIVRDSAGIRIVENDHTKPAWAPGEVWRIVAEPEVQIGAVEGDSAYLLYQAHVSRRLPDGRIAVANNGTAEVRIYGDDGRHVQTIGRRGRGPGEFIYILAVWPGADDSLFVHDADGTISVFDGAGAFVRRFRLEFDRDTLVVAEGEPLGAFADGSMALRIFFREDRSWTGLRRLEVRADRFGRDGARFGSLGTFDGETVNIGGSYAFGPWGVLVAADTSLWYGPGDRFELREVALDGRTLRLVRLDRTNRPVTDDERALYERTYRERMSGSRDPASIERHLAEIVYAQTLPAHYDIRVDDAGHLWVESYNHFDLMPGPNPWSVFDREGRYLGEVTMPEGLRVTQIGADFVLGGWTDSLGVEYVRLHRIEKPGR